MNTEEKVNRYRTLIISVLILLSVSVRLAGLGGASLTMNEAELAVSAMDPGSYQGGQLLYVFPTSVIFKFFGCSGFTARIVPALFGILLSLLPLTQIKRTGWKKACLLSFIFAVDPVLLYWGKRADSLIPALSLAAAAVVFLTDGKSVLGLVSLLLGMGGGERFWPAAMICLLFAVIYCVNIKADVRNLCSEYLRKRDLFTAVLAGVLLWTGFGTFPGGLGNIGTGFAGSFGKAPSWAYPGLAAQLIAVVLAAGIPLLFFVTGTLRNGKWLLFAAVLAGAAVLTVWQGVLSLPWITALLWAAGSDTVLNFLRTIRGKVDFAFSAAAFVIPAAYAFFYFRMVEMFSQKNGNAPVEFTWNGTTQTLPFTKFSGTVLLTVLSVVILALIVKILMGFVESGSVRRGMLCGFVVIYAWMLVTGIWNSGGFDRVGDHPLSRHTENSFSLFNGAYTSFQRTALFEHLEETVLKHGDRKNTEYGLNLVPGDPMLAWELRDHPGIRSTANLNPDLTGVDMILDRSGASFESSGFVSAAHAWRGTVDWNRFSFQDWGKWLIFGDGKFVEDQPLRLWVRADWIYALPGE